MAKIAIIRASALTTHGRWDAAFHITQSEHREECTALEERLPKEDARQLATAMLGMLSAAHRQILAPLVRTGQTRNPSADQLGAAVHEYPYLAIAVMRASRKAIIDTLTEEVKAAEKRLADLREHINRVDVALK